MTNKIEITKPTVEVATAKTFKATHWKNGEFEIASLLSHMSVENKKNKKSVPCFLAGTLISDGPRNKKTVKELSLLIYDIDAGMTFDDAKAVIKEAGYQAVIYTTFTHSPEHHKLRIVLFPDSPFQINGDKSLARQWKNFYHETGEALGLPFDKSCSDPSRLFLVPACPSDNLQFAKATMLQGDTVKVPSVCERIIDGLGHDDFADVEVEGYNLSEWNQNNPTAAVAAYLYSTDPEKFLAAPDEDTAATIECVNSHLHSSKDASGAFASNGDGGRQGGEAWNIHCMHHGCKEVRKFKTEVLADILNSEDWNASINDAFFQDWFLSRDPQALLDLIDKDMPSREMMQATHKVLDAVALSDDLLLQSVILDKLKQKTGFNKLVLDAELKKRSGKVAAPDFSDDEILSPREFSARLDEYAKDFCRVNVGGTTYIIARSERDIEQGMMKDHEFVKAYAKDVSLVAVSDDEVAKKFYAKEMLARLPETFEILKGGIVFDPRMKNMAGTYNIYQPPLIKSNPDGDCSLMHDLILDVWAGGDEKLARWYTEYLYHLVARPGDKVRTAIALRGAQRTGKTFVFEQLLPVIFGRQVLIVEDEQQVLGTYNQAMSGKILVVLDEAAFAGDAKLFEKLKSKISSTTHLINPKNKSPYEEENFSRMVILSNKDHFIRVDSDDSRYTVSEVTEDWKGTDKFSRLLKQWKNGGAARFMYEAQTHEFATLADDPSTLWINKNYATDAGTEQKALSRSPIEKAIFDFLLRGKFVVASRDGLGTDSFEGIDWEEDKPLHFKALAMTDGVRFWMKENDPSQVKYVNPKAVMVALEKFFGLLGTRKAIADGKQYRERRLPSRSDAAQIAYERDKITADELLLVETEAQEENSGSKGDNIVALMQI